MVSVLAELWDFSPMWSLVVSMTPMLETGPPLPSTTFTSNSVVTFLNEITRARQLIANPPAIPGRVHPSEPGLVLIRRNTPKKPREVTINVGKTANKMTSPEGPSFGPAPQLFRNTVMATKHRTKSGIQNTGNHFDCLSNLMRLKKENRAKGAHTHQKAAVKMTIRKGKRRCAKNEREAAPKTGAGWDELEPGTTLRVFGVLGRGRLGLG